MFFIGIFGIQQRSKILREFNSIVCPQCGRWTRAELTEEYTYFHFFFIPLFKWNRRYFISMRCCQDLYELGADYVLRLKNEDEIDFSQLKRVGPSLNLCPACHKQVDPSFIYCPHCGQGL